MAIFGNLGAHLDVSSLGGSTVETYFSEAQSGILVTCRPMDVPSIKEIFHRSGIPVHEIGRVDGGDELNFDENIVISVTEARRLYEGTIPEALKGKALV